MPAPIILVLGVCGVVMLLLCALASLLAPRGAGPDRSTAVTATLDQHPVTQLTALISAPRPEQPALIPPCLHHVGFRRWLACRMPTVDYLRKVCDTQPGELCDIHVYRDRSDGSWCVLYQRSQPHQSTIKDPGDSVLFERIVILVGEWNATGRPTYRDAGRMGPVCSA